MTKRQIENALAGIADRVVVHKDGTFTARATFFYRNGGSAERLEQRIAAALPNAIMKECDEVWKEWPKESYWFCRFRLA